MDPPYPYPYAPFAATDSSVYFPKSHYRDLLINDANHTIMATFNQHPPGVTPDLFRGQLILKHGGSTRDYSLRRLSPTAYLIKIPENLRIEEVIQSSEDWAEANQVGMWRWEPERAWHQSPPSYTIYLQINNYPLLFWHPFYFRILTAGFGETLCVDTENMPGTDRTSLRLTIRCHDPLLIPEAINVNHENKWVRCQLTILRWIYNSRSPEGYNGNTSGEMQGEPTWRADGFPHHQGRDAQLRSQLMLMHGAAADHHNGTPEPRLWNRGDNLTRWSTISQPRPSPTKNIVTQQLESSNADCCTKSYQNQMRCPVARALWDFMQTISGARNSRVCVRGPDVRRVGIFKREEKRTLLKSRLKRVLTKVGNRNLGFRPVFAGGPQKSVPRNEHSAESLLGKQWGVNHIQNGPGPKMNKTQNIPTSRSILGPHPSHKPYYKRHIQILNQIPNTQANLIPYNLRSKANNKLNLPMDTGDEELIRKFASLQANEGMQSTTVTIPREEATSRNWGLCVIARVCTDRAIFDAQFERQMRRIWKLSPEAIFKHVQKGCYLVELVDHNELKRVQDGGPWVYRNDLIAIGGCTSPQQLKECQVPYGQIGVQLHNLPPDSLTENGISLLLKPIGVPLSAPVEGVYNGNLFLRLIIKIDVEKPLKDKIRMRHPTLGDVVVYLVYEKIGRVCFFCGGMGHEIGGCVDRTRLARIKSEAKENNRPELENILNPTLGPWLLCPAMIPVLKMQRQDDERHGQTLKRPIMDLESPYEPGSDKQSKGVTEQMFFMKKGAAHMLDGEGSSKNISKRPKAARSQSPPGYP